MKSVIFFALLTVFFSSLLFSTFVFGGSNDVWISCQVSGGDYSPGQSTTVDNTTYYCCCTDGNAGWTTTACSYPRNVKACSKGGASYFADKQLSDCTYVDRDNICRSSAFASDCTAASACNGKTAGTTSCDNGKIVSCSSTCAASVDDCPTKASTDSDGGDKPLTKGTVKDFVACSAGDTSCPYNSYTDYCSGNTLTEYYPNGSTYGSKTYDCKSYESNYCDTSTGRIYRDNWACSNGACVDTTDSLVEDCPTKASTDSDGGDDPFTKGTVKDFVACSAGDTSCPYNSYTDYCSGNTLTEYIASGASYTTKTYNCNSYDGWYSTPNGYEYRDYSCSAGACNYTVTQSCTNECANGTKQCSGDNVQECRTDGDTDPCTEWVTIQTCTGDGWYGGGNNPGCGDDPSSEYRDYYCDVSTASCKYNVTQTVDCDASDVCSNYCTNNKIYSYIDYYVIQNSSTCTYSLGSLVDDCLTKPSTDTDGGDKPFTKGTVTDYTGCATGSSSCSYTSYTDYCSANILTEYYTSDSSYGNKTYDCTSFSSGYYCDTATGDIYYDEWACSNGACVNTTDSLVEDCVDTCSDSDGGQSFALAGTVTDKDLCSAGQTSCPQTSKSDYCLNSDKLVEYYCSGNDYANTTISCSSYFGSDYSCRNGRCVDSTPPTVSVSHTPSSPTSADEVTYKATASDAGSGLNKIEIYVDGTLAKTCPSSPCNYTAGPYPAGSNHSYYAIAYDNAGNSARDPPTGSYSFTVGEACVPANPTVTITPSSQKGTRGQTLTYTTSVTNNDNSACGTSTFTLSCSVPSGWSCSLQDSSLLIQPGSSNSTKVNVTSSTTASFKAYTFNVTAINDNSGLSSTGNASYEVTEYGAPTVSVEGAPADWQNTDATASVSCYDAESGCDTNSYRLYISSSQLASCPTNYNSYTLPSPQTISSHVWVCGAAKDNVGNVGFSSPVEFKVDKKLPYGSIVINNGEPYTNSINVLLTLSYGDDESGVKDCRYSNDAANWTAWENCASNKAWSLTPDDGNKTVYYQIRDKAGNIYQTNDSIILDTTKPTVDISHSPAEVISTTKVTYKATASDAGSGLNKIEIYVDGTLAKTCPSSPCNYTAGPYPAGSNHSYYAIAYDNAGNSATTPKKKFTVCKFSLSINPSVASYKDTQKVWQISASDASTGACPASITYTIPSSAIDIVGSCNLSATYVSPTSFSVAKGSSLANAFNVSVARNATTNKSCSLSLSVFAPDSSQVATGTYSVASQSPPKITEGVNYTGSTSTESTVLLWCDATDAEDPKQNLKVKVWVGKCSMPDCFGTRHWDVSGALMSYNSSSDRFEYYWKIPYAPGTYVAATCQAYDTAGASSNWGDAYPLFQVTGTCNNNQVCEYGETTASCPTDCFTRITVQPKTVSPGQEVTVTIEFNAYNYTWHKMGTHNYKRNVSFNLTIGGIKWSTQDCKIAYKKLNVEELEKDESKMHREDVDYMEAKPDQHYFKIVARCRIPTVLTTGRYEVKVVPIIYSKPKAWVAASTEIFVFQKAESYNFLKLINPLTVFEVFAKIAKVFSY